MMQESENYVDLIILLTLTIFFLWQKAKWQKIMIRNLRYNATKLNEQYCQTSMEITLFIGAIIMDCLPGVCWIYSWCSSYRVLQKSLKFFFFLKVRHRPEIAQCLRLLLVNPKKQTQKFLIKKETVCYSKKLICRIYGNIQSTFLSIDSL